MKTCAYCSGQMNAKGLPRHKHSHGICKRCVKKLEDAVRFGEPQVRKCDGCPRNIGGWRKFCVPCGGRK